MVTLTTIAPKHLRAHDFGDVESVGDMTRTVSFIESVDFAGVPQPVQDLAHMPGNPLSAKRTADFTLENGAWKVQSVEWGGQGTRAVNRNNRGCARQSVSAARRKAGEKLPRPSEFESKIRLTPCVFLGIVKRFRKNAIRPCVLTTAA